MQNLQLIGICDIKKGEIEHHHGIFLLLQQLNQVGLVEGTPTYKIGQSCANVLDAGTGNIVRV